jgi:hypothetical protein
LGLPLQVCYARPQTLNGVNSLFAEKNCSTDVSLFGKQVGKVELGSPEQFRPVAFLCNGQGALTKGTGLRIIAFNITGLCQIVQPNCNILLLSALKQFLIMSPLLILLYCLWL